MKLPLPAILVFLFVPATGELLSSPPHSVCHHKKTSLTGWLVSLTLSITRLTPHFSSRRPNFTQASLPSVTYSNSK